MEYYDSAHIIIIHHRLVYQQIQFFNQAKGYRYLSKSSEKSEVSDNATGRARTLNPPRNLFLIAVNICRILCQESMELAEQFIQSRVTHSLMVAMGNQDSADSQRQASVALEVLCRSFPVIDQHARDAMGEQLYNQFIVSVCLVRHRAYPSYQLTNN